MVQGERDSYEASAIHEGGLDRVMGGLEISGNVPQLNTGPPPVEGGGYLCV